LKAFSSSSMTLKTCDAKEFFEQILFTITVERNLLNLIAHSLWVWWNYTVNDESNASICAKLLDFFVLRFEDALFLGWSVSASKCYIWTFSNKMLINVHLFERNELMHSYFNSPP
jgi:hypothetical protein